MRCPINLTLEALISSLIGQMRNRPANGSIAAQSGVTASAMARPRSPQSALASTVLPRSANALPAEPEY